METPLSAVLFLPDQDPPHSLPLSVRFGESQFILKLAREKDETH